MEVLEKQKAGFLISTDIKKLDIRLIHSFLYEESGWSKGIPFEKVQQSISHSLNFGLYAENSQVGYARVITDYSTICYLGDVFILEKYRGLGLSKWMMEEIMSHPDLVGMRRWILLTSTADWLYKKFGFTKLEKPEIYMEKYNPDVYKNSGGS